MEYIRNVLLASLDPAAAADNLDGAAHRRRVAEPRRSGRRCNLGGRARRQHNQHRRAGGGAGQPTAPTVLAITGCLIAGVPVVPVPADVGAAERRHILTDSGAQGPGSATNRMSRKGCRTSRCGCMRGPGIATPSRHPMRPRW
jgi:hypothetical protein